MPYQLARIIFILSWALEPDYVKTFFSFTKWKTLFKIT